VFAKGKAYAHTNQTEVNGVPDGRERRIILAVFGNGSAETAIVNSRLLPQPRWRASPRSKIVTRGNAMQGFLMTLESHRHIKSVSSEIDLRPDGTVKPVSVIHTDLELNSLRPGYDAAAVEELVARLQLFQKTHHQPFRILTTR
jgi:hypothetical protein